MYAVIETGGKQYRATPGEFLEIESIAGDIGAEVEFNNVLAVFDGESVKVGSALGGALVPRDAFGHPQRPRHEVERFRDRFSDSRL